MFDVVPSRQAFLLGAIILVLLCRPAFSEPLGADLQRLVEAMERFHPALNAASASRDAAAAEIEIAGALDDPQFGASFEDIDREDDGPLPQRVGSIFYSIEQTFPLGGKRALRRKIAQAGVAEAATERDQTLLDLTAQMKTAFAQHALAILTARTIQQEGDTLRDLAEIARDRYAQGLGRQQDAFEAEAELAALEGALADAERDRAIAVGRINALIGRSVESPLAQPAALPPILDAAALDTAELIALAERRSPALAARTAAIDGANASRDLAERNWYPDLTLGVSVVDEDRDITGYEAKVGFNIPLQWGLRRSQQAQAKARLAEAKARASAARVELSAAIVEALENLRAANAREAAMRTKQLPRLAEAVQAAQRAYAADQADLADAIGAARRFKQAEIEHIGMLFEQQTLLAELERLVGGSL
ncbi:TolC family protein [Dongia deserti]|uniref:TolC family protein n=1 Tax=Dongia deserti TaxID=2268030 RepID=UPI000E65E616|nr:TolC family protein [Dongia deserti]